MDNRKLQCFLAVAFEGNLTRASESLYLSQSALSGQIKQLEEELGFPLFVRQARGMSLTHAGEVLLPYARTATQAMDDFRNRASLIKNPGTASLTVGLNTDPAFLRMADLARLMRSKIPGIRLSFIVSQSRTTAQSLRSGEMNMGFRFGIWGQDGIHDEHVAQIPLAIAIPSGMATQVEPGDWKGLAKLPWVNTYQGCPFHVAVRERMSTYGVEPNAVEHTVDENIMRELVTEGMCIAVLREKEAERLEASGHAVIWPEKLQVPLCLSYPAGSGYVTPLKEFRNVVREVWS